MAEKSIFTTGTLMVGAYVAIGFAVYYLFVKKIADSVIKS